MAFTPTEEAQIRQLLAEQPELLNLASNEATIISKLGAQKKNLGQLTAASSLNDTDLMFVRQGTSDKSTVFSQLKSFFKASQAEVNAGVVDDKFVTPAKLRFGFAANIAANGYISFPTWMGGLIMQWGSGTNAAAPGTAITFPLSFPSNCFAVTTGYGVLGTAPNVQAMAVTNITNSGFTAGAMNTAGSPFATAFKYIAIGN